MKLEFLFPLLDEIMLINKSKPLTPIDKVVLEHLNLKLDDIDGIKCHNVFGQNYRVNIYRGEFINKSYWMKILNQKVLSSIKD